MNEIIRLQEELNIKQLDLKEYSDHVSKLEARSDLIQSNLKVKIDQLDNKVCELTEINQFLV